MHGLMQAWPLTLDKILDHAKGWHGATEIVTRQVEGPIVRTTYAEAHGRAKRLSGALLAMGVKPGDRVATLGWNTARHFEAWYAIMGIGAVCHTLNPRLPVDQLCYIIGHAEDVVLFTDVTFLPVLAQHRSRMQSVRQVVVMTDEAQLAASPLPGALAYETLIAQGHEDAAWGGFDENTAAGLCYTSGTTGEPKGVLYSHRSNFLHTLVTLTADAMGIGATDVVLPIVPMFHANAWGLTFSAPACGAKLVMPGARLDGASLYELIETEGVTFSAAVPTVWQGLLNHLRETGDRFSRLRRVVIGGSAAPESMIRILRDDYGVEVAHAWGMTEMSPTGTLGSPTAAVAALAPQERLAYQVKQGRPPIGVEMKITDDAGRRLAHDGHAAGRLKVRGAYIAAEYFKGVGGEILDDEGFFDTGDVATIDPEGFMQVTDRAKDVIKSGGEWISSIALENLAAGHPKAELTAVVGAAHPRWGERPVLIVKLRGGEDAEPAEFLSFLEGKIPRWWTPDAVLLVDDIPLGTTGKVDKKLLRQRLADYVLPESGLSR